MPAPPVTPRSVIPMTAPSLSTEACPFVSRIQGYAKKYPTTSRLLGRALPPLPPARDAQEVLHSPRRSRGDALAVERHRAAVPVEHEAAALPHEQDAGGRAP